MNHLSSLSLDASFVDPSIQAIKQFSGAHHIISGRIELIRLLILSLTDCCAHAGMAAIKFSVAVIQGPLCLGMKGLAPRITFAESASHAARSLKFALAIPVIPLIGLLHPQSVVNLFQRVGLVERSKGGFLGLLDRVSNGFKAAWRTSYCDPLFLSSAAFIGGLFLRTHYRVVPSNFGGLGNAAGWPALVGVGAAAGWHLRNSLTRASPSQEPRSNRSPSQWQEEHLNSLVENGKCSPDDRQFSNDVGYKPELPVNVKQRIMEFLTKTSQQSLKETCRTFRNVPVYIHVQHSVARALYFPSSTPAINQHIMGFLFGKNQVSLLHTCRAFRDVPVNIAQHMCLYEDYTQDPLHKMAVQMMQNIGGNMDASGHMWNVLYGLIRQGDGGRQIAARQFECYSASSRVLQGIMHDEPVLAAECCQPIKPETSRVQKLALWCKDIMVGKSRKFNLAFVASIGVENYLSDVDCARTMLSSRNIYRVFSKGMRWRSLFEGVVWGGNYPKSRNYFLTRYRNLVMLSIADLLRHPPSDISQKDIAWKKVYNLRYFQPIGAK